LASFLKNSFLKKGYQIKYIYAVILVSTLFTILFSFYSILKAYTINAYGWDLGLYSQAFYSAIHGKLLFTTLVGGSYLSEHFAPFMFLLVPFFYIYPSPYTLLVIQSIFLSFASVPLYYLSVNIFSRFRDKYPEKIKNPELYSFIVAMAFLLSPLTESPVYFDFHLMIFLPFFYFMSIYFYLRKKQAWNVLFLILIVSLHSSFVFIVAMTLLMEILISRYYHNESPREVKNKTALFIIGLFILLVYYSIAGYLKGNIANNQNVVLFVTGESGVTSKSILGLVVTLIYNPHTFLGFLLSNYKIKVLFLVLAFMAVDFAFYEFPIGLLPALPYLVYAMTSSYIPYYFPGYQYSMMFIPIVFVAGVFGISRMMEHSSSPGKKGKHAYRNMKNTFIAIAAFAIASFIVISPISPLSLEPAAIHSILNDSGGYRAEQNQFIYSIRDNIDMNSSLVTGNNIFPLFYKDMNATAFPYGNISNSNQHFKYLIANFNDSQTYIKNGYNISLASLATNYVNNQSYGILAEGYGIIALEFHYTGKPILYKPFNVSYLSSEFVENNNSIYGPVPNNNMSNLQILENTGSDIYTGNSTYLLPGNYSVSLILKDGYKIPTNGFNISVLGNNGKTVIEHVNRTSEHIVNNKITFTLNTSKAYTGVIYTVFGTGHNGSIKEMTVAQKNVY
jgi:uncharacterized membrane protein